LLLIAIMRAGPLLVVALAACDQPTPATPVLSMLHGVEVVAASDRPSTAVTDRVGAGDPDCAADAYGGIELAADVAPDPGIETVLASYSRGVIVLGADGHRIASTPGFGCTGTRDELAAVEIVRTSFDAPVIAVAATSGGRRESSTWLALVAVGSTTHLDRLFVGEVERRDETGTHPGEVRFVPGGLVYRHPTDGVTLWRYDAAARRYVPRGARANGYSEQ